MAFRKARSSKIGGKFLAYGYEGTGKSWFALTFPNVACIDSETGNAHYEGKNITLANGNTYNNLKLVDNTSDLDDLENDIDEIMESDDIQTLDIDSETKFYAAMQVGATEVEERKARRKGGDVDDTVVSQRQWGRIKIINMKLQQAKIDLSSKGKHIVSVAQASEIYEGTGENRKLIGIKPDMHKSVKFDYDTILEFYKEENGEDVKYFARVKKDRTNVTKVGQIIENPSYDIWKNYFDAMNGLNTNETTYKQDIKTSTESMIDNAEKAEELSAEFKDILKSLKENKDALSKVNKLMKEKEVDLKKLEIQSPETLTELIDFAKLQLS